MTDINKIIRKVAGAGRNVLTVYVDDSVLNGVTDSFSTVFAVSFNRNIKKRNVVYREKLEGCESLTEIGIVLLHKDRLSSLKEMRELFNKTRAPLMIFSSEFIDQEFAKLLKEYKYQVVDMRKTFQLWTFKK